jgi:hypothetical protein
LLNGESVCPSTAAFSPYVCPTADDNGIALGEEEYDLNAVFVCFYEGYEGGVAGEQSYCQYNAVSGLTVARQKRGRC